MKTSKAVRSLRSLSDKEIEGCVDGATSIPMLKDIFSLPNVINKDGFILNANPLFLETMGFGQNDKNQVIGKHHSTFVSYEYSKSDEYVKFWESLRSGKFAIYAS